MINAFATVRRDLYRSYGHVCDARIIDSVLEGVIAEHSAHAAITTYLPVLVAREAAELIEDHIWASGDIGTPRQRIIFISEDNASRARFAAAVARRLSDNGVVAEVAAVHPEIDSEADARLEWVLDERGLNAPARTVRLTDFRAVEAADVVVMMGGTGRPVIPGRRVLHWDTTLIEEDTESAAGAAEGLNRVRGLCDEIEMQVFHLLIGMGVPVTARTAAALQAA